MELGSFMFFLWGEIVMLMISQYVVVRGFFWALGSTELPGGTSVMVGCGQARSADSNNGVSVVYDEKGEPWVRRRPITCEERDWLLNHGVSFEGAYVPHSNGGDWIDRMERLRDENAYTRMVSEPVS